MNNSMKKIELEAIDTHKEEQKMNEIFRVADTLNSTYESRYGWSGSVCQDTEPEKLEDCIMDAVSKGMMSVEFEVNVVDYNNLVLMITFSPSERSKRGRLHIRKAILSSVFHRLINMIESFDTQLGRINVCTDKAMRRVYDGSRFHDDEIHEKINDVASRMEATIRAYIQAVILDDWNNDESKLLADNATQGICVEDEWEEYCNNIK